LLLEDRGNGRPRYAMPQILQRALDASAAPARILRRHAYDQAPDLREHAGASRAVASRTSTSWRSLPMPAQKRVGRDNRRNLRQNPSTKTSAEGRQAAPVVVHQPHALIAERRLQDPVLLGQVRELVLLVAEPADKKGDEQVQASSQRIAVSHRSAESSSSA